jgi:hypothetical protein
MACVAWLTGASTTVALVGAIGAALNVVVSAIRLAQLVTSRGRGRA